MEEKKRKRRGKIEKKRRQITVIIFPNPRGTGACVFKFKDGSHRFANGARLKDYETSNAGREQNVRCTHKARRILIKASWRRVDEGGKANDERSSRHSFFLHIYFFFFLIDRNVSHWAIDDCVMITIHRVVQLLQKWIMFASCSISIHAFYNLILSPFFLINYASYRII